MRTNYSAVVRTIAVLAAAALTTAHAQESRGGWNPPLETRPVLVIHGNATGSGRSMTNLLTGSIELTTQEYAGMVMTPGFDGSPDLCVSSVLFSVSPADLDRAAAAWHVEGRLVELRQGEATIDLRWTRRINRSDLVPSDPFTSEQRLIVREGDRGVLDLVRSTASTGTGCDSFGLTYEVQFEGPRPLTDAAIAYDLWLVQRDADGELVTDQYKVTAKQGQQVDYFFRPIEYNADGRRSGDPAVDMSVSGTIRGRVRSDGDIDLTVDGSVFAVDHGRGSATGTRGRTLLTVRPGETVEVEARTPGGQLQKVGDVARVFAGHRTAIRVTVRRLW